MECTLCPTLVKSRTQIVQGRGPIGADIMCVGEAPGREEDEQGKAFCGPAGKVLARLLTQAGVDLSRVYLANSCLCRPPGNRTPTAVEIETCRPNLLEEIKRVQPKVILSLGASALRSLWKGVPIGDVAGQTLTQPDTGVPMVATYHPAYVMRQWSAAARVLAAINKALRISQEGVRQDSLGEYVPICSLEALQMVRDYIVTAKDGILAFDTETTGLSWMKDELLCISLSLQEGVGFVIPTLQQGLKPIWSEEEWPEAHRLIGEILSSPVPKAAQNASFDLRFLERSADWKCVESKTAFGWKVENLKYDTLIASRMLCQSVPHDLDSLMAFWTDLPYYSEDVQVLSKRKSHMEEVPNNVLWEYAGADADVVKRLVPQLLDQLTEGQRWLLDTIVMPVVRACWNMEQRGLLVDTKLFATLSDYYKTEIEQAESALFEIAGEKIKYHGVPLQKFLFEKLALPIPNERTDKANECGVCRSNKDHPCIQHVSTAADTLARLNDSHPHPALPLLLKLSKLTKFNSTYLGGGEGGYARYIRPDNRIHAEFKVGYADTGRHSCEAPNLQNQPKGLEVESLGLHDALRQIFVAPKGHVIMEMDWCLAPETRVLTADLRWLPISEVVVGDKLVGIDEGPSTRKNRQKMRVSTVLRKATRVAGRYKISFASGEQIIATAEHPWLARLPRRPQRAGNSNEPHIPYQGVSRSSPKEYAWISTDKLFAGAQVRRGPRPWEGDNPDLRFVGGFIEGEGCLDLGTKAPILSFSQKEGVALENVLMLLRRNGFNPRGPYDKTGASSFGRALSYYITSCFEIMRLLGAGRPARLLEKAGGGAKVFVGREPRPYRWDGPRGLGWGTVVSVEYIGTGPVVSIQTDTRTFLAEGFFCHNCQFEVWALAYQTGDPTLLELLRTGSDVHTYVSRRLGQLGISKLFPDVDPGLDDYEWQRAHGDIRRLGKCMAPETRILRADLRWVPLSEIQNGDEIIAFDETPILGDPSPRRYLRRARVVNAFPTKKELYEVLFSDGSCLRVTDDHPFLTDRSGSTVAKNRAWRTLSTGLKRAIRLTTPWERDTSYEAGWLSGFFDGEGCVAQLPQGRGRSCAKIGHGCFAVSLVQNAGPEADTAARLCRDCGFTVSQRQRRENRQQEVKVLGGVWERLRFLGTIRPERLIRRLKSVDCYGTLQRQSCPEVVSVTPLGLMDVVSLETSSKTFIAEGFAVHNTFTFGLSYGLSAPGAADRLGCSIGEAEALVEAYKTQVVPSLESYFEWVYQQIVEHGGIPNKFGRWRYFPEAEVLQVMRHNKELDDLVRVGINFPIQSGAHDLHQAAHVSIENCPAILERAKPILEVHDSLAFEAVNKGKDYLIQTAWFIKEKCEKLARNLVLWDGSKLGWECLAEISWGPSLGDQRWKLTARGDIIPISKDAED